MPSAFCKEFLLLEDVWCFPSAIEKSAGGKPTIEVVNLCAFWGSASKQACLEKISFSLSSGDLLTVVGPVGSGKTSLLLAILREIPIKAGKIDVNGKISYSSQESWTFNSSIQENIIFGCTFDAVRYTKALNVTALDKDIDIMPSGDKTMVGERGISLSGGQRARVALARYVLLAERCPNFTFASL